MIGQTIEAPPRLSLGAILFLILALLLLGLSVTAREPGGAVGALGLLLLAATLAWNRPRHFVAHFTDTELQSETPTRSIPYEEIESVHGQGRNPNPFAKGRKSYAIEILTPEGSYVIPRGLNVPSDEVYLFLYQSCEKRKKHQEPSADLRDYFLQKQRQYGKERVHTFKTRSFLHSSSLRARSFTLFLLTLAPIGAVWVVCGAILHESGWMGAGCVFGIFGLLLGAMFWQMTHARRITNKRMRKSCLVISPDGLALVQGHLTGQLHWTEVRDVKLGNSQWAGASSSFQAQTSMTGILVKVAGAVISIADIYDGPLPLIFQLINYYRRGEEGQDTAERIWKDAEEAARADRRGDRRITER